MTGTSTNTLALAAPLAAVTGAEHVRALGDAVAVAPANSEELAAILRFANTNHCSVAPWGGGTKQGWGNRVTAAIVLETHRLNQVREHTWQDMTCTVEAGCTWASMQAALAQHGQRVGLDPLWPDHATVGGIVATNDSGALRLRYGGLRDLIIGMTIVLADGTVAKTGGKVVKNVAGYDLHKLMTGAFGTLGVITSVNFRLHSIPQSTQSFTFSAPAAEPPVGTPGPTCDARCARLERGVFFLVLAISSGGCGPTENPGRPQRGRCRPADSRQWRSPRPPS